MKKTIFISALCCVFALSGLLVSSGEEGQEPKRYGIRCGIIDYVVSGNEPTYMKLYFDDWGMRLARHSIVQKPIVGIENILTIQKKEQVVKIDLGKRIATKKEDLEFLQAFRNYLVSGKETMSEFETSAAEAQFVGQEDVAGLSCEVWEDRRKGIKIWYWNWVPLKIVREHPTGRTVSVATAVRENVPVSQDIFNIPSDIQFVEGNLEDILLSSLLAAPRGTVN